MSSGIDSQEQEILPVVRPSLPLNTYSRLRIGRTWTAEDHRYLEHYLRQIDALCVAVWEKIMAAKQNTPEDPGD
jgi:hypothetical protein